MYTAERGMKGAEKALDADARSIASSGPSVGAMVDVAIQPEIYAANARVVKAAGSMAESTFNMLA